MKRSIVALLFVGVIAIGGVFATGQSETPGELGYPEVTSLQGRFTLLDGFPGIETPEGTYTLGAPRAAWVASTIEEGTQIEVEGYLIDHPFGPRGYGEPPESEGHLRVTRATIEGETYDVTPPAAGPGMMGRPGYQSGPGWGHHDRMGGWGSSPHGGYPNGGYPRGGMMGGRHGYHHGQDGRFDQGGYGWNRPDDGYRRRW